VLPKERRFTHSCLKDGYKTAPILKEEPKMKKKQCSKMSLVNFPLMEKDFEDGSTKDPLIPPPTPIPMMQSVGVHLGVDPSKITAEMFGADLSETQSTSGDD
jgi:ferredoxin-NADP reductase